MAQKTDTRTKLLTAPPFQLMLFLGVFLAPAVTDLIILVLSIVMLAGEFRGISKLAGFPFRNMEKACDRIFIIK